jgi:hypothetical protein
MSDTIAMTELELVMRKLANTIKLDVLEACAKIAEEGIEEMETEHRLWREAWGDQCAQPYDEEITTRRRIAERIRALAVPRPTQNSEAK